MSRRVFSVLISLLVSRKFAWFTLAWTPQRAVRSIGVSTLHRFSQPSSSHLHAKQDANEGSGSSKRPKKATKNRKRPPIKSTSKSDGKSKEQKQKEVAKAAAELNSLKATEKSVNDDAGNLLNVLDPFKAGKKFRQTIDTALTTLGSGGQLSPERRSVYYADDRFLEPGGALFSERNPLFDRMQADGYVPEVLVVGATGTVGRLVVRRLLLDGRFRVRVLVRDLYSKTLNMLGTGVTYCQGDLGNIESLEYAVTDVDKIVFCAGAPRADEADFSSKFEDFVKENLEAEEPLVKQEQSQSDIEWEQLESILELRARLAEQVDCVGMQNLVCAYQNVRFADYGTSQAAKRSLFKFQDRPEDFYLFAIDDDDETDAGAGATASILGESSKSFVTDKNDAFEYGNNEDSYADMIDEYAETDDPYRNYEDEAELREQPYTTTATRKGAAVKAQVQWMKNKFEHGVFVGKVPKQIGGLGGEATVVSSRLRAREDPEKGIDLSNGFAGLVCRLCADGGTYEAFVRSEKYETDGIEYVCEFRTPTKPKKKGQSQNRFTTVRLPFENFVPTRRNAGRPDEPHSVPPFRGQDVRQIGFRYRSESNNQKSKLEPGELTSFYLAFCYIKVYRSQPEPEFVFLSDARIPPVVHRSMVQHGARQLVLAPSANDDDAPVSLLDEATLKSANRNGRSTEETYYKFRGEEILRNSGLSYAIVRVSGYNESPSGEASTIDLKSSNDDESLSPVSRDEVAQVCVSALMDPDALNKSFYMTKTKQKSKDLSREEDMSSKFGSLPADQFL